MMKKHFKRFSIIVASWDWIQSGRSRTCNSVECSLYRETRRRRELHMWLFRALEGCRPRARAPGKRQIGVQKVVTIRARVRAWAQWHLRDRRPRRLQKQRASVHCLIELRPAE